MAFFSPWYFIQAYDSFPRDNSRDWERILNQEWGL